eukprot:scaffold2476_cov193-Amphora_coffeaeformis.AAC.14
MPLSHHTWRTNLEYGKCLPSTIAAAGLFCCVLFRQWGKCFARPQVFGRACRLERGRGSQ